MKVKGVMSVFLSLILVCTITFLMTLLFSARIQGAKLLLESGSEVAISSFFGGYDEKLFKDYSLFGKDLSYGRDTLSLLQGKREIEFYLNKNLGLESLPKKEISLIGIKAAQVGILDYQRLSDPEILMSQIEDVMKTEPYRSPLGSSLSYLRDMIEEKEAYDVEKEVENLTKGINFSDDLDESDNQELDDFIQYISLGISDRLSIRSSNKEIGLRQQSYFNKEGQIKSGLDRNIILGEYIRLYFGDYLQSKNRALDYEKEYLIMGKSKDMENIKGVIQRIFMIQWAYHYLESLNNGLDYPKANLLAITLVGYLGEPAISITTQLILLYEGYAKSEKDLIKLMRGDKIALSIQGVKWEVDYEDYLQGLLLLESMENKLDRMIHLIENNLKEEEGYQNIKFEFFITEISVRISSGLNHSIFPFKLEYDTSYQY